MGRNKREKKNEKRMLMISKMEINYNNKESVHLSTFILTP